MSETLNKVIRGIQNNSHKKEDMNTKQVLKVLTKKENSSVNNEMDIPDYSGVPDYIKDSKGLLNNGRWIRPYYSMISTTSQIATAGRVFLKAFEIPAKCEVDAISVVNGTSTVSGSAIVGIYGKISQDNDTCSGAVLIIQSESTALPNPNGIAKESIITFIWRNCSIYV